MKVALIWSSPNKDGLTNSAAMQFKKGLENYGIEVTEIHFKKKYRTLQSLRNRTRNVRMSSSNGTGTYTYGNESI